MMILQSFAKKIARDLKQVKQEVTERNELLGNGGNNAETVRMSSQIRNKIREALKDADTLGEMHEAEKDKLEKKKAKGKDVSEQEEKGVLIKAEIVELVFKHIDECKNMERSGFGGSASTSFKGYSNQRDSPELPDIENDEAFTNLHEKDRVILDKVEQVGQGVATLKDMANEMGKEIELQTVKLAEIDHEVDKTNSQLNELNVQMKKLLISVRSADRFIIDFILLVVFLAILGFIYNTVKKW